MSRPTIEQLRPIDLFEGLDDAELDRFAQAAELRELEPGAVVAEQGQPRHAFNLVLAGSLEAIAVDPEGRMEPVGEHAAPTWVGAITTITGGITRVRMQASTTRDAARGLMANGEHFGARVAYGEIGADQLQVAVDPVRGPPEGRSAVSAGGDGRLWRQAWHQKDSGRLCTKKQ